MTQAFDYGDYNPSYGIISSNPPQDGLPLTETVFEHRYDPATNKYTDRKYVRGVVQGCMTEEEALDEAQREFERERDRKQREEFHVVYNALTLSEQLVYEDLNKIIEDLETAGVDISYFPHEARMVLIEWAKLIDAKVITWTEDRGD